MRLNRFMPILVVGTCLTPSCANRHIHMNVYGTPCTAAGPRLSQAWRALNDALQTPGGCEQENGVRCEALKAQIERLSVDCPNNPEVVMANALMAFDARNFVRAQQLLDELFGLRASNPEAGVLRTRIALEQGNVPFALRFAEQQVRQIGDDAGLRETYASALYLSGRWDEAIAQLLAAQNLGAPVWRVAYGLGIIAEAVGKFEEAKLRYQEALDAKPAWKQAESRLRALIASGRVQQ
jgi:predicted Zn-dependent protease